MHGVSLYLSLLPLHVKSLILTILKKNNTRNMMLKLFILIIL